MEKKHLNARAPKASEIRGIKMDIFAAVIPRANGGKRRRKHAPIPCDGRAAAKHFYFRHFVFLPLIYTLFASKIYFIFI
jgi:hypothetical protein